ncbi:MAG: hypothetical protein M3O67_05405 [Bacteroidota bacterium]|nr:hypothetical protein [Bacteroidota bacterium]
MIIKSGQLLQKKINQLKDILEKLSNHKKKKLSSIVWQTVKQKPSFLKDKKNVSQAWVVPTDKSFSVKKGFLGFYYYLSR